MIDILVEIPAEPFHSFNFCIMRVSFTGDILCYASQIEAARIEGRAFDFSKVFDKIKDSLKESDYVCGSLETPIADAAYTSSEINFNTPFEFLDSLSKAGFDLLTTGNNHCLDRGVIGLKNTIHALDYFGLEHTGTYLSKEESEKIFVKEIGGIKIAFLSYTYGTNSRSNKVFLPSGSEYMVDLLRKQDRPVVVKVNIIRRILRKIRQLLRNNTNKTVRKMKGPVLDSVAEREISNPDNKIYIENFIAKLGKARKMADFVVFCMHSGGQFNYDLGIGAYTEYIVKTAMENGADIVVGNHTHCVMPAKIPMDNKFVSYALGNFSFTPGEGYYVDGVYADYSILLHIDFVNAKEFSVSFSVLKSVKEADGATVYNVYDLYRNEKNREHRNMLEKDVEIIVRRFTGKDNQSTISVNREYKF